MLLVNDLYIYDFLALFKCLKQLTSANSLGLDFKLGFLLESEIT